jgi:hypothetical protein
MTADDIIRIAREAGLHISTDVNWMPVVGLEYAEKFAALVVSAERERIKQANAPEIERINAHIKELEDAVKAEREACAKIADGWPDYDVQGLAEAIRARGQA